MFYDLATRALRTLDPEQAHDLSLRALQLGLGPREGGLGDPGLAVHMAGLNLPNCVGLAAGYDKNARVFNAMFDLGFGFAECGTVTPLPQGGNPKPRQFRLNRDHAVINRMGFNNEGLECFARRLDGRRKGLLGANIGANKDSNDRIGDYVAGLTRLWGRCDYFTVNVSSPNTPGLRALQGKGELDELTGRLAEVRGRLRAGGDHPVFLKVAPDLDERQVRDIVEVAHGNGLDGLVVSNTTVAREDRLRSRRRDETGGLSGAPLMALSTHTLRLFHEANGRAKLALIGAGGVASGADAYAKIRAGACAVQLYTALAFQGPSLVRRIKRDLARRMRADGFASIMEAVGAG